MALYEATFAAICDQAFHQRKLLDSSVSAERLAELDVDIEFQQAMLEGTTQTKNVKTRLNRAKTVFGAE